MSGEPERPYRIHVFVCTHGKTCPRQGSVDVHGELRRRIKASGLSDEIRVNKSGCMAQCGYGPMVVVYPEGIWYHAVRVTDVEEIVGHLRTGAPIERLRYRPDRSGVRICPPGEEPIPPTPEAPGADG